MKPSLPYPKIDLILYNLVRLTFDLYFIKEYN